MTVREWLQINACKTPCVIIFAYVGGLQKTICTIHDESGFAYYLDYRIYRQAIDWDERERVLILEASEIL